MNLWLLIVLFFITRFFFLAGFPHFYDGSEYLRLSLEKNYFLSLSHSHESIHPVYLFFSQIFQLFHFLTPEKNLSLISAIFGLIGVIVFYFLMKRLFNKNVAVLSLLPLIFFTGLEEYY